MRALLLVNPHARLGDTVLRPIFEKFRSVGIEPLHPPASLPVWEFPDYVKTRSSEADVVIVGGGDGTLSTAARAIADCGLPMGILPLGTANDLARTLGIPLGLEEAIDVIATGRRGHRQHGVHPLGAVGFANSSAYVTAKHGILGLTKVAAIEYASRGVRVTAVGPAFIDTPLLSKNLDAATLKSIAGLHPLGRLGLRRGRSTDLLPALGGSLLHYRELPSRRWRLRGAVAKYESTSTQPRRPQMISDIIGCRSFARRTG